MTGRSWPALAAAVAVVVALITLFAPGGSKTTPTACARADWWTRSACAPAWFYRPYNQQGFVSKGGITP